MSMHRTPEEHEADPPQSWRVVHAGQRCWHLVSSRSDDYVIASYLTKREAEAAKTDSPWVRLYEREGRWFRGEPVNGWKPYAVIVDERERRTAWLAVKAAQAEEAEALRRHLRTTEAHALYIAGFDLASMTRAELVELHDDMPVTVKSCRDCPSKYR